ncbi:MAG TPA: sigma 54-interacting transcriptional regulator [Kofleriaceae bacterium]|nr:sigma 54-interacting transcriptional regulator [Kofleriaceae bacterium]
MDLELLRHLSAVARRRGLTLGWLDAAGNSSLPHANQGETDEGGEPAPCPWAPGGDCETRLLAALNDPGEWHVVEVHPSVRELVAPVRVGGAVAGALLAGAFAADDTSDLPTLGEGEIAIIGDLLALAAREVAAHVRATTPTVSTFPVGERKGYDAIIGSSVPMQALYATLDRVARSDATILIQGENGTGKELVARAIHNGSNRGDKPFVVTNCSAFNDNLLDSELFGHKRGAFTGAVADKPGLFEIADNGTFFLDEIGDMSPALQVKVLRVLQEGTFNRVGDTETRKVDVRIIAATNRDLRAMVAQGLYREDLYYRIHVINLVLPPLRERSSDVAVLVEHFLERQRRGTGLKKMLAPGCIARMSAYPWPGNVRELENEIERLVVLSGDDPVITEELLSPRIRQHASGIVVPAAEDDLRSLPAALESLERRMIVDALRRHAGNKTRASADLKVSRRNLIRLVQKYGLGDARS